MNTQPGLRLFAVIISFFILHKATQAQFGALPPFKLSIEPVSLSNPALGYHSFAFAQSGSKWLIIGGRTNGLHGLNANDPFPQEFANNNLVVIDTATWQVYSYSLSNLPKPVADPLRSTNMQYTQVGNYLYMLGGYGRDSVQNRFVTFPVVTKIDVSNLINAVITQSPVDSYIKQVSDTTLRICGGEMHYFNNRFYLVFGHDFNGRYANPFAPIYTQVYANSIKSFSINENAGNISITHYLTLTDTINFHRRDLNVLPIIKPNGEEALMAYSGVFQKDRDFPYFEPILIDTASSQLLSYTQVMSHYTCAALPVYDNSTQKMHTVFFGGLSFNDYDPQQHTIVQDTNVPFISDITCFTLSPGNVCEETVMPVQLPGLLGTNAKFVVNNDLNWYSNGVLNYNTSNGRQLAGYIFGGIRADMPNLGNLSVANDTVYRVYIEPDPNVSVIDLPEEVLSLTIFPNPASSKIQLNMKSNVRADIEIQLIDINGKRINTPEKHTMSLGTSSCSIDVSCLNPGVYMVLIKSDRFTVNKKVIINR